MNKHPECVGCRYNTPTTQGGKGRICNGFMQPTRCPEWAINEYIRNCHKDPSCHGPFTQEQVREFFKVGVR